MKANLKIVAILLSVEAAKELGGCDHSEVFRQEWEVERRELHYQIQKIPIEKIPIQAGAPSVQLWDDDTLKLSQIGNQIDPAKLQEYIIDNYLEESSRFWLERLHPGAKVIKSTGWSTEKEFNEMKQTRVEFERRYAQCLISTPLPGGQGTSTEIPGNSEEE